MNKNLYILAVLVGLVAIASLVFWFTGADISSPSPTTPTSTTEESQSPSPEGTTDSTVSINQSIDEVDLGDLDAEFQAVDEESKGL